MIDLHGFEPLKAQFIIRYLIGFKLQKLSEQTVNDD